MAGIGAIEAAGFGDQAQPVPFGDQGDFDGNLHTAQLAAGETAQLHLVQAAPQLDPAEQQPRPVERPGRTGTVIRPNIPHWNGPPLQEMARQRGFVGRGGGRSGALPLGIQVTRDIGFNNRMNSDVQQLARDTGIVLNINGNTANPYHQAIAQEYTENLGYGIYSRYIAPPMTREQAVEVVRYRLAELTALQPPSTADAGTEPAPEGTVRLQIGAVTHTMPSDSVQPDPTCHPNGFWAPDPGYASRLATQPDAAHYQDQINGGRVGLNYYIPRGADTLATAGRTVLDVQSYDGCISPESALTGAPVVTRPTLVEAKQGYGSFFQGAEERGYLNLSRHRLQAEGQARYAGGTPLNWYASDPTAVPYFTDALAGLGVSVLHEPLR